MYVVLLLSDLLILSASFFRILPGSMFVDFGIVFLYHFRCISADFGKDGTAGPTPAKNSHQRPSGAPTIGAFQGVFYVFGARLGSPFACFFMFYASLFCLYFSDRFSTDFGMKCCVMFDVFLMILQVSHSIYRSVKFDDPYDRFA